MPVATAADLIQQLRRYRLLEPAQLEEVERVLVGKFPDPKNLVRELVQRGWLSHIQANRALQDRGQELLKGNYVLLEEIGEGGMGNVYKARNWKLGQIVALKIMRKDRMADRRAVDRFLREIRAASRLIHPNIVRAMDAEEDESGHLMLVMEFVDGTDLSKLVKMKGALPVEQACDFIRQAATGLQHAFECGMVHRDIKPHNLLVSVGRGQEAGVRSVVKILDMGLARLTQGQEDGASTMTQEGAVMGTPDYISPEQAHESHDVDIRADLYSLGCTFFYLLTGQPPFPKGSLMQKLTKHANEPPPPVESLRPGVPRSVSAIVQRLLAKSPGDRHQTPAELIEALDRVNFADAGNDATQIVIKNDTMKSTVPVSDGKSDSTLRGVQTAHDSDSLWSSILDEPNVPLAKPVAAPVAVPATPKKRSFLPWIIGAVVLVAGIVGLIVYLNRGSGPAPAPQPGPKTAAARPDFAQWLKDTAALSGEKQAREIAAKLRERNPAFDGTVKPTFDGATLVGLEFLTDHVTDIAPVQAATQLTRLDCRGKAAGKGRLVDLSSLKGLTLTTLDCRNNPLHDLSPLKGMPLANLNIANTAAVDLAVLKELPLKHLSCAMTGLADVAQFQGLTLVSLDCSDNRIQDLTPLAGQKLESLRISGTLVKDLVPLAGMPLAVLACNNTDISDVSPLAALPLTELDIRQTSVWDMRPLQKTSLTKLQWDFRPWRDNAWLKSNKSLTTLNGIPAADFWQQAADGMAKFDAWAAGVVKLTPAKQVDAVAAKLRERNQAFIEVVTPVMENDVVVGLNILSDNISDLSPVRALPGLHSLTCIGSAPGSGQLWDLAPLSGLKLKSLDCHFNRIADLTPLTGLPLTNLHISHNPISDLTPLKGMPLATFYCHATKVVDLAPVAGMKLTKFWCGHSQIGDLSVLKGMPLVEVACEATPIKDLTPLQGAPLLLLVCAQTQVADLGPLAKAMSLEHLQCHQTKVTDLSPLHGLPLKHLVFDVNLWRELEALAALPKLETINGAAKADFLKPRTDFEAWAKKVATLPVREQEKAIVEELKKRNAGFDGSVTTETSKDVLTSLQFATDNVTDIAPVRALPGLKRLVCIGTAPGAGKLADLWPLMGLPLAYLRFDNNPIIGLDALRDMPLQTLSCAGTQVTDLAVTQKMPLTELLLDGTPLADLEQVRGLKLASFGCARTPVPDLFALKDMPLKILTCDFNPWRDTAFLKSLPKLVRINGTPADVFWKKVDADQAVFDAWAKQVALQSGDEQVKSVAQELSKRNPGFDGNIKPSFIGTMVVGLEVPSWHMKDLSPVRALPELKTLILTRTQPGGPKVDLWPLKGLTLTTLGANGTPLVDLAPLQGMPLTEVDLRNTQVTDFSPLRGLPLRALSFDFVAERDRELVRSLPMLQTINGQPAAEYRK